jgi:hypothetical protein
MGTGSFPGGGVENGRGVTLTPHHLLVPSSKKSRAILDVHVTASENYLIIIIIIFINCNWVVTRWQLSFNTHTKHEMGLLLNFRPEGYMRSM